MCGDVNSSCLCSLFNLDNWFCVDYGLLFVGNY